MTAKSNNHQTTGPAATPAANGWHEGDAASTGEGPAASHAIQTSDDEAVVERAHDHSWSRIAAAQATASDMTSNGVEFQTLLHRRDTIERTYAALVFSTAWTPQAEAQRNAALDPILSRLYKLARKIAELPSATAEHHRIKALALIEFCEERSDDVVHRLASSLAADLLRS
jgi:hypothetical protein